MVKNPREKGNRLERPLKKIFVMWGWEMMKSGGSFGTDLMGMKGDKRVVISAKWLRKYFRPKDREEILKAGKISNAYTILAYKTYEKKDINKRRGRITLEVISDINVKGAVLFLGSVNSYFSEIGKEENSFDLFLSSFQPPPYIHQ